MTIFGALTTLILGLLTGFLINEVIKRLRNKKKKERRSRSLITLSGVVLFIVLWVFQINQDSFSFRPSIKLLSLFIFTGFLLLIFVYDLRYYLILDKVVFPSYLVAFIINLYLCGSDFVYYLLGSFTFGFFIFLLYYFSKGRWIGGGDVKLAFLVGLMVGFPNVIVTFFLTFVLGAIVGVLLILQKKKKRQDRLPLGTFMTAATYLSFLFAESILIWYQGLLF